MGQGFDVIVFLQEVGFHRRVVSSFTVPPDEVNCNANCHLNNMGGRKTEKMESELSMLVNWTQIAYCKTRYFFVYEDSYIGNYIAAGVL